MLLYPFSCRYWKKKLNIGWKNTTAMWNKNSASWMFWRFVSRILCLCQSGARARAHSLAPPLPPPPPTPHRARYARNRPFPSCPQASFSKRGEKRAKPLIWKWVFIHFPHNKGFALSLTLTGRVCGTRQCPISGAPFSLYGEFVIVRTVCYI